MKESKFGGSMLQKWEGNKVSQRAHRTLTIRAVGPPSIRASEPPAASYVSLTSHHSRVAQIIWTTYRCHRGRSGSSPRRVNCRQHPAKLMNHPN